MNQTILDAQKAFNTRYGVKLDMEEFDGSVNALNDFSSEKSSSMDDMYRATFSELYKKAFANYVDHRMEGELDFAEMLTTFDKTIMEPYRQECQKENRTPPSAYGGWTVKAYLNSVNGYMHRMPESKFDFAADRYSKGKLPMREMRAYCNQLKTTDPLSSQ